LTISRGARDARRLGCAHTVAAVLGEHFHGPLRLDLADLSHVDVAGMRALRGSAGQRLVISPCL
jgi:hypothetical protein